MVCFRYVIVNTLHDGDDDDVDNNNNNLHHTIIGKHQKYTDMKEEPIGMTTVVPLILSTAGIIPKQIARNFTTA
jgi:hypothetical protein